MIDWADVTPIIVTRGDVDLTPIIETLPFSHVVIWNNGDGSREDLAVYGRYAAIAETASPYIFVVDDDVILAPHSYDVLLAAHEPGHVTCNMPERFRHDFYKEHALVGFGAIFDRDLPELAFRRFFQRGPYSHYDDNVPPDPRSPFARGCDIPFTVLTPRTLVDVPHTDREFASAHNRMWKESDHIMYRGAMLHWALGKRDGNEGLNGLNEAIQKAGQASSV